MEKIRVRAVCFVLLLSALPLAVNAEVAVVVSANSRIAQYDEKSISNLFLAKVKTLPDIGRIIPVDLEDEHPAKEVFYTAVTKKSQQQLRSYWSRMIFTGQGPPPESMASDKEMAQFLARNPDTIGYIDAAFITDDLRVLKKIP